VCIEIYEDEVDANGTHGHVIDSSVCVGEKVLDKIVLDFDTVDWGIH
jgi:hypothetical protein